MGLTVLWLVLYVASSWASQVPMVASNPSFDLSRAPSVNATGHLVFATATSLLQHWPNTRYRNGHNIVPGIVSPGTLLYHGRRDSSLPQEPEWTATDPEHSYMFCRARPGRPGGSDPEQQGCWHLTLVVTRPLNVLYFDGSSAAKMDGGPMDSQDIVSWGKVDHDNVFDEKRRIKDLCKWGEKFAIDGFVRMEMDFEIMLCNFTNGVDVASMLNLQELTSSDSVPIHVPGGPGKSPPGNLHGPRPGLPGDEGDRRPEEAIFSGSWHNQFPGEIRIQLDYSRLVSFYDTALAPSLVNQRFNHTRLQHRIDGISEQDVGNIMQRLEEVIQQPHGQSVVDWRSIMHITVNRFGDRLEDLQYLLNTTNPSSISESSLKRVQVALSVMVQPYALLPLTPSRTVGHSWASRIFEQCATMQTKYLHKIPDLTSSELLLLQALEETNTEICRVVTSMWAEGVEAGLDEGIPVDMSEQGLEGMGLKWSKDVTQLMNWLDWGVWVKCRPACAYDSICYLPTWPYFLFPRPHRGFSPGRPGGPGGPEQDDESYMDPQPKCMPRFAPIDTDLASRP